MEENKKELFHIDFKITSSDYTHFGVMMYLRNAMIVNIIYVLLLIAGISALVYGIIINYMLTIILSCGGIACGLYGGIYTAYRINKIKKYSKELEEENASVDAYFYDNNFIYRIHNNSRNEVTNVKYNEIKKVLVNKRNTTFICKNSMFLLLNESLNDEFNSFIKSKIKK